MHATGDFFATSSADSWALHEIQSGKTLLSVPSANAAAGYSSIGAHPDGLLLATGTVDSLVKIWDVKTQKNAATFEGHKGKVIDVAFSENGYYLATAAEDNTVKLWDLRKPRNFQTIELGANFKLHSLDWDYSGTYLVVAGADIRVYAGKTFAHVSTYGQHTAAVTDVKWGADAKFFVSVSLDRSLKVWGSK